MKHFSFPLLLLFISCETLNDINVDFNNFDRGTTLTLKAYFHDDTDCGEFGGHKETIIIIKERNELKFSYKRDSSQCLRKSLPERELTQDTRRTYNGELTTGKQRLVMNYINKLYNYNPSKYTMTNAIDHYEFELKRIPFTTTTFSIDYAGNDWKEFETLRNELINR